MGAYQALLKAKSKVPLPEHQIARLPPAERRAIAFIGQVGTLPITADLFSIQDGLCFHCFKPMDWRPHAKTNPYGWTREHVLPASEGGTKKGNIVLAHQKCNNARGTAPLSPIDAGRARLITLAVRLARKRRGIASY